MKVIDLINELNRCAAGAEIELVIDVKDALTDRELRSEMSNGSEVRMQYFPPQKDIENGRVYLTASGLDFSTKPKRKAKAKGKTK